MDFKEAIKDLGNELKQFFSEISEPAKQIFKDFKLEDGSIIRTDNGTIEPGAVVTVITQDGEVPIPDGDYVVVDGDMKFKITVESGYITAKEEIVEQQVETEQPNDAVDMESKFNEIINTRFAELSDSINKKLTQFIQSYESDKTKFNENLTGLSGKYEQSYKVIQALNEFVQKVGGQPSASASHQPFNKKTPKPFDLDAWRREQGLI